MDNNIAINIEGLSKKYKLFNTKGDRMKEALHPFKKQFHKDFYALKNVNLQVKKGEILGIVGMNGSGKSTLLKIISGIIPPSGGKYQTNGRIVPLLELGSGFNPEFTGIENIYFYNGLHGKTKKQTDEILQDIIDFAEIGEFINQPLKTYSSGMKARLAFAVSINIDPEILILDEILAVGDELFKRKCFARMEKFFKGGKTILFVSHSVQSINQICTKAVFLNKGEIILKGPTKMVTAQYERYLYSQKENKDKVRNEIKLINQGTESKENYFQQVNTGKKETIKQNNKAEASEFNKKSTVKNYAAFASENKKTSKTVEENSENAFFIPNFKPKSQVEYREADVDIHDIKILDQEGRQVNVLMPGEKYFYEYKVRFNIDASNVVFGMMIKTEKGVNLASTNSQQYSTVIKHILNNTSYTVSWAFVCNMLQGNYYTNAGVSEFKDGKHIYLNRIVDAMVFKVRSQKSLSYNGLIKIDLHPEIEEL